MAPAIAERAGLVKASFVGSWGLWAALLLVLGGGVAGVAVVMREARRP
jgi:hypothetical protein